MKGTTIAVIALGIVNLGLMGLDHAANKHGRKAAELEAIQQRGEEANAAMDAIKKRCDIYDVVMAREKKMAKLSKEDWIKAHDFNERRKDILNGVSNGLQEFKNQIGYSEIMQEITDKFDAGVEAVKATLGYSVNKAPISCIDSGILFCGWRILLPVAKEAILPSRREGEPYVILFDRSIFAIRSSGIVMSLIAGGLDLPQVS